MQRTRDGGAEVVALLKTGSAFYAPAASVGAMVDAILNNRHMILPCAAYLEGQYGVDGLYVGVPTRLGSNGVEGIVEIGLTAAEQAAFAQSAAAVQEQVDKLVAMGALGGSLGAGPDASMGAHRDAATAGGARVGGSGG